MTRACSSFCISLSFPLLDMASLAFSSITHNAKWLRNTTISTMMQNSQRSLSHLSRVNDPLVRMSASRFWVSTKCRLDHWVTVDLAKQPIKSNSVGAGYVSHCRDLAFNNHLDHCFIALSTAGLFGIRRHKMNLLHFYSLQRETFLFRSSFGWILTLFLRRVSSPEVLRDLHGTADSFYTSDFVRAFSMMSLNCMSSGSIS